MSQEPFDPLRKEIWQRGARLGVLWLGLFFTSAAALYGLMGLFGWEAVWRALCAMFIGPLVGTVIIAGWWIMRRPRWDVGTQASQLAARGEPSSEVRPNHEHDRAG